MTDNFRQRQAQMIAIGVDESFRDWQERTFARLGIDPNLSTGIPSPDDVPFGPYAAAREERKRRARK